MSTHFLPFFKYWAQDVRTWCMHLQGRYGRPQTDHLLGMDWNLLQNVSIWNPLHNFDHYMVLGCLHSATHKENHRYLGNLRRPPLRSPGTKIRKDRFLVDLCWDTPKPPPRERWGNKWISEDTWCLVATRVASRRELQRYQRPVCKLVKKVRLILKVDRKCCAATVRTDL